MSDRPTNGHGRDRLANIEKKLDEINVSFTKFQIRQEARITRLEVGMAICATVGIAVIGTIVSMLFNG